MAKAERTRQYIIEKTAPLFNCKGFDGTTLSDLERATGLTKGSLYGNFSDKEEIALEAFRYAIGQVKDLVLQEIAGVKTYKGQLLALVNFYARYVFDPPVPGGCPLLNTAIEADDHRTGMRRIVTAELTSTVKFIASLLRKGVAAGEFRKGINARELAYSFFCAIEGALMFSRVEGSREPMNIIVRHCKKTLDKISL
ncbi:MAG TPA: TetR/AcrR family transcriptional regulator [Ohtaekwangia sp.]|nr:TetR/AcrR family transcriptional regulator [Ohtaekwangia sp.]